MVDNARNQYLQTQIMTASREQLILMLYDGLLRFCNTAKAAWEDKDLESAHKSIVKAQSIVLELAFSLDKQRGGEMADNLAQLYTYCYTRLVTANISRDPAIIDEVMKIIDNLREAWSRAMPKMATEGSSTQANSGVAISIEGHSAPSRTAAPRQAAPAATQSTAPAAAQKGKGVPLAKIPVARIPVSQATPEQGSRLSVEG